MRLLSTIIWPTTVILHLMEWNTRLQLLKSHPIAFKVCPVKVVLRFVRQVHNWWDLSWRTPKHYFILACDLSVSWVKSAAGSRLLIHKKMQWIPYYLAFMAVIFAATGKFFSETISSKKWIPTVLCNWDGTPLYDYYRNRVTLTQHNVP